MSTPKPSLLDLLPPKSSLRDIYENFGLDVMLKVWNAFQGEYIYVPTKLKEDNRLVAVLGFELAVKFCQYYEADRLHIEKATKLKLEVRNQMIRDLVADGVNQSCIARMMDLDVRQIERIVANIKSEKQQDLFDNV